MPAKLLFAPQTSAQMVAHALASLRQRDFASARHFGERVLDSEPDNERALAACGGAAILAADLPKAEAYFNSAADIEPTEGLALAIASTACIAEGYAEAGPALWRRAIRLDLAGPRLAEPYLDRVRAIVAEAGAGSIWFGEPCDRLLIGMEQMAGLGDLIQDLRYLAPVRERCQFLGLVSKPSLVPLVSRLLRPLPVDRIFQPGEVDRRDFDCSRAMSMVPAALGAAPEGLSGGWTNAAWRQPWSGALRPALQGVVDSIASRPPYLAAEPARVERWGSQIKDSGFKVGICWRSGDWRRAILLSCFERFVGLPGVRLVSLQVGAREELDQNRAWPIVDFGAALDADGAFLDTAAIMRHLDLVISTDTSIAHLAGALGVPVWTILRRGCDSRWGMTGATTALYPTMRLFRQPMEGDWATPISEAVAELARVLRGESPRPKRFPSAKEARLS